MQALSQLSYTPVRCRARDYSQKIQPPSSRETTASLSESASTASREGVWARPQTATRTAGANWPIFRPCAASVSLTAAAIKETLAAHGLKMPQLAPSVRVLVTGRAQTPSLDAVLEVFDRETVLARLAPR